MLPSFATQTITRQRPAMVDDGHGNRVPDWTSTTDVVIPGCSVQPGATAEDNANRDGVLIHWTVYAPSTVDVQADDAVVYEGTRYAVNGNPARWGSGILNHVSIQLRRWEG